MIATADRRWHNATTPPGGNRRASSPAALGGADLLGVRRLSSVVLRVVAGNTPEGVSSVKRNTRQTGRKAASAAGKVLANPRSTKSEKAAAASALSQAPKRRK